MVLMAGMAQSSTLDDVKARGVLACGVNTGLTGFAAPDAKGVYQGFDAALCKAVAAAVLGDAAKVRYVDICDDLAPTREMLTLDADAKAAGVPALVGMGNSPGLANIFVKMCAEMFLDEVHSADIMHIHGGEPEEGAAVIKHRIFEEDCCIVATQFHHGGSNHASGGDSNVASHNVTTGECNFANERVSDKRIASFRPAMHYLQQAMRQSRRNGLKQFRDGQRSLGRGLNND
jgi:hypothetical protein